MTWATVAALLAAAGFVCYGGPNILDLGFYHDDWNTLSHIHFAPDSLPLRMAALAQADASQLFRPFDIILWPTLYRLFGLDPVPWQAFLLCVNIGIGLATARLLLRFKVPASLALLGGILILSYPSKDANLFWPLNVINPLSLLFYLVGHLAFLSHVESGNKRPLIACVAALLLSLTTYDQTAFLPLCWLITPRLFEDGFSPRAKRGVLICAAVIAVFLCYKLFIVPHSLGVPFSKAVVLSPWQFLKTYLAGLNAQFGPRLILAVLAGAWRAATSSPFIFILAMALPWLGLAALKKKDSVQESPPSDAVKAGGRASQPPSGQAGAAADALALLGAAVFAVGYLPIALSDYVPTPLNHQNRINLAPALGIVLAALGCAAGKVPAGRGPAVLAAIASVFLAASAGFSLIWAESYRLQCGVTALVQRRLPAWPEDKLLLVLLPDRYVAGKAPVFDAYWDVTGAIRLAAGDTRRRAAVISPRMRFEPGRIVEAGHPDISYADAVLLDVAKGTLSPADFPGLAGLPPLR